MDGAIDVAATSARRASLSNQRSTEEFVFGPERAAYEARLPSSVQDLVAELLVVYPAATRQFLRDRLYARIESDAGLRGSSATRRALQAVLEETMAQGRSAMGCPIGKQCIVDNVRQHDERVHYGGTWQQARGYSPMVKTEGGRILWLSGHVGVTEESGGWGFAPDFDAQVHQSFRNIQQTLARAGGHLRIVTMTAFIIDAGYSGRFIEIRKGYFPSENFPCSALIVAAGFAKPGLMVEIQAVAVVEPE